MMEGSGDALICHDSHGERSSLLGDTLNGTGSTMPIGDEGATRRWVATLRWTLIAMSPLLVSLVTVMLWRQHESRSSSSKSTGNVVLFAVTHQRGSDFHSRQSTASPILMDVLHRTSPLFIVSIKHGVSAGSVSTIYDSNTARCDSSGGSIRGVVVLDEKPGRAPLNDSQRQMQKQRQVATSCVASVSYSGRSQSDSCTCLRLVSMAAAGEIEGRKKTTQLFDGGRLGSSRLVICDTAVQISMYRTSTDNGTDKCPEFRNETAMVSFRNVYIDDGFAGAVSDSHSKTTVDQEMETDRGRVVAIAVDGEERRDKRNHSMESGEPLLLVTLAERVLAIRAYGDRGNVLCSYSVQG